MDHFTTRFWIGALAALAWLFAASNFTAGQTPPPGGGDDIVLSGFLQCSSPKDSPIQCPSRLHYVNLMADRNYAIRMQSTEFSASLTLEDLKGNLLAADTDCWQEDLNGCILFRPPTPGTYRLVAKAATPLREGFYTITIHELPVVMRVENVLTTNDESRDYCFHQIHDVTLIAGQRYIIELASDQFRDVREAVECGGHGRCIRR